jgi:ATP-binding cassette subfamily F protein 3
MEKQLAQLQKKQTDVEQKLAAPDIYDATKKSQLRDLIDEQTKLKRQVDEVEAAWLDITAQLEEITNNVVE